MSDAERARRRRRMEANLALAKSARESLLVLRAQATPIPQEVWDHTNTLLSDLDVWIDKLTVRLAPRDPQDPVFSPAVESFLDSVMPTIADEGGE